jgi:hypothetical protein
MIIKSGFLQVADLKRVTALLAAVAGALIAAATAAAATTGERLHAPPVAGVVDYVTGEVLGDQITALDPGTDLVTITIGGNDAGFGSILRTCTVAASDSVCIAAVDAAEDFARSVLPGRLARVYAAIRGAAPRAHVIVLGYPRLFELTPGCSDPLAPNLTRRTKLNEGADVIDSVIYKTAVQQPGFGFADVRDEFAGHGVCSADPWINGPSVPSFVGPYHPNQQGYRDGYLAALDATSAGEGAAA